MTAAAKAPSAKSAGGAARSETKKKPAAKRIKFRGLVLKGPAELPGTLDFDLGDVSLRAEEGDEQAALSGMHRLIESLLGRGQLIEVRSKIKGPDDPWQEELLRVTIGAYGADSGKP